MDNFEVQIVQVEKDDWYRPSQIKYIFKTTTSSKNIQTQCIKVTKFSLFSIWMVMYVMFVFDISVCKNSNCFMQCQLNKTFSNVNVYALLTKFVKL